MLNGYYKLVITGFVRVVERVGIWVIKTDSGISYFQTWDQLETGKT